jgi:SAM-dependent methyltransferase
VTHSSAPTLESFLKSDASVTPDGKGIFVSHVASQSPGLHANRYYFSHPTWLKQWFDCCHRYPELRERWLAAIGNWNGKIVVDIGCGPGNLFANLGGSPAIIIGVDVARGSLEAARAIGYTSLLADAQNLPLCDAFADIVAINSTLHHCDDMARVLHEGARLVKPGGLLITDHDPQKSAFALNGLCRLIWNVRVPIYRLMRRGGHAKLDDEQAWALATEIHHRPGDGVDAELFHNALKPLGFQIRLLPHNNLVGMNIFNGVRAKAPARVRITQRLSGIDPDSPEGAITMMCVATRSNAGCLLQKERRTDA